MNMGTASEGVIINALWILIPVTCWIVTLWIYGSIFIAQHETLNRGGGGVAARLRPYLFDDLAMRVDPAVFLALAVCL